MRRNLRFQCYDDVLSDASRLATAGYDRLGKWGLGQACDHLAMTMERSLDGFPSSFSLPLRVLARWVALGGILKHKQSNRKFPAPAYLDPPDSETDQAGLAKLQAVVKRLQAHTGEMRPHPVFGGVTPDQWREIHLWHSEHHLSFLIPKA
jgi:hypothetical protein